MNKFTPAAVGVLLSILACAAPQGDIPADVPAPSNVNIDALLASMTLEEKVGQCFVVAGNANVIDDARPEYKKLARLVQQFHAGGVIWYRSKVYETAILNEKLQSLVKIPLIVACDLEAGMGMRFDNTPWAPWPMAIAATGDPDFAEALGLMTAFEARAIGISQIYAPVADVNVNPKNPVINTRSFGEDPADVSRFVNAFVKGCENGRVLATVKHFPGHGDTDVDSHRSLPVLNADRDRLDRVELLPFREAFAHGCRSVMIAHLAVPALDPAPAPLLNIANKVYGGEDERQAAGTLPATVSDKIVNGLLRKEMGFDGLAVTDAMDMGGLADHFDAREGAIRALLAGCDQILKSGDPEGAMTAVADAVRGGRIPMSTLDAAVRRILKEKMKLQLFSTRRLTPDAAEISKSVATPEHDAILQKIARRSITLVRAATGALPLARGKNILHIAVTDETGPPAFVYSNLSFTTALREESGAEIVEFTINPKSADADLRSAIEAAKHCDAIVMSLNVKARTGAGTIQAPALSIQFSEDASALGKPFAAVSLGSPYVAANFPAIPTFLLAYGSADVSQRAAAAALFGKFKCSGRLPVSIPGVGGRGDGILQ
ncbi:MAG: glycoside hydrolase family 3 C-terminal domain-containing protein [Planctomycetes bacterium]|nr:glycoside hydrolase family 3 C-terminal domain-containing protein [Planctomycetota bacterium]